MAKKDLLIFSLDQVTVRFSQHDNEYLNEVIEELELGELTYNKFFMKIAALAVGQSTAKVIDNPKDKAEIERLTQLVNENAQIIVAKDEAIQGLRKIIDETPEYVNDADFSFKFPENTAKEIRTIMDIAIHKEKVVTTDEGFFHWLIQIFQQEFKALIPTKEDLEFLKTLNKGE